MRSGWWITAAAVTAGSLGFAGALISSHYDISIPALVNSAANTDSQNYKIQTGVLGQGVSGKAQSAGYTNSGSFESHAAPPSSSAAPDLSDAYVYPNPFKPNSPGRFRSENIIFKHLPADVRIKVFAITGKQVAELHKTDAAVDYYEWNVTNSAGQKLAGGVYLYFMTAPDGGKAKGKFAVLR